MSKQQDLKTLVKKYEDIKNSGKLKLYSEEQTKKDFILPLLRYSAGMFTVGQKYLLRK